MPADAGENGSRGAGPLTRRATSPRSGSGRYRQLGKDELLNAILYETADAAAAEEAALTEALEGRQRAEEARRREEEHERRRVAAASVEEEQRRRQQAQAHRHRVAQQIEEEQLRLSGLWSRFDEHRPVAPDTGELARLTDAQLRAASARSALDEYRPSEVRTAPARRVPTFALGAAVCLVGSALAWWGVSAGSAPDESIYARSTVAVTAVASPSVEVATRAAAPERESRRARRERSRDTAQARREQSDGADAAAPGGGGEERDGWRENVPLDITLDSAGELWRVGSE